MFCIKTLGSRRLHCFTAVCHGHLGVQTVLESTDKLSYGISILPVFIDFLLFPKYFQIFLMKHFGLKIGGSAAGQYDAVFFPKRISNLPLP